MQVNGKTGNYSDGPRVINVGAFFSFNSTIGRSVRPALLAGTEDVNSDSCILKNTKLNLILQDTNCSGFLGTFEGKKKKSKTGSGGRVENPRSNPPPRRL